MTTAGPAHCAARVRRLRIARALTAARGKQSTLMAGTCASTLRDIAERADPSATRDDASGAPPVPGETPQDAAGGSILPAVARKDRRNTTRLRCLPEDQRSTGSAEVSGWTAGSDGGGMESEA